MSDLDEYEARGIRLKAPAYDSILALCARVLELEVRGPVMPETPSETVIGAAGAVVENYAHGLSVYRRFHDALLKEQAR